MDTDYHPNYSAKVTFGVFLYVVVVTLIVIPFAVMEIGLKWFMEKTHTNAKG